MRFPRFLAGFGGWPMLSDFSADAAGMPVAYTPSTPTPVDGSSAPERIESLIDTASHYKHRESCAETDHRYEKAKMSGRSAEEGTNDSSFYIRDYGAKAGLKLKSK